MAREIARRQDDEARVDATNPVALLQYAVDQKVEPAKLKELMDLANAWQDREAAKVFGEAMAGFQAECPPVVKTRDVKNRDGSGRYKFASIDDVDEVVRPILARYRISTSGTIGTDGDVVRVRWTLQCGSHREVREFTLPKTPLTGIVMGGNPMQDMGAWLSYIRRYTYCLALNVVVTGEDTDANSMADLLRISQSQREELDGLIAQEQMDEAKIARLLKWIGAESLDAITIPQFQKIVTTYRQRKAGAA